MSFDLTSHARCWSCLAPNAFDCHSQQLEHRAEADQAVSNAGTETSVDSDSIDEHQAELELTLEENTLQAETEFEQAADNFEARISGNVGFNVGWSEAEKLIAALREQKAKREAERKCQQQTNEATGNGNGNASDMGGMKDEKPLLVIKRKSQDKKDHA